MAGQQFEYTHDDIGNRSATKAGGDENGVNSRSSLFTANALNQYSSRTIQGAADVMGVGRGTITVNSQATYRRGEYFRKELTVANNVTPAYPSVTVTATQGSSVNQTGNLFVPRTPENFGYDSDGNLTSDGRWTLTWDGENRLIRLVANTSAGPPQRIDLEYDEQGRRIRKQVWNNTAGTGPTALDVKCLYDGWNLIAELDANNAVLRAYMWGLDLSGTPQGAGGVGGLLKIRDGVAGVHYFMAYDGNGNVAGLVNAADGNVASRYDYGPFGEVLRASGTMAKTNPFRFSTKYTDDETDFVYYGYRYYNPSTGRWLNRDPIGEAVGINLYGFVYNNPVNRFDRLGLDANTPSSTITPWELGWEWLTGNDPRHRDFGPGDYMTEGLRKHEHVKDSIDKMKTEIFFRCQSCKNGDFTKSYPYSLAGWGGVLKYLHDYSTLGTGGMTGNLVVTYLGSYGLDITASDIKCSQRNCEAVVPREQLVNRSIRHKTACPRIHGMVAKQHRSLH